MVPFSSMYDSGVLANKSSCSTPPSIDKRAEISGINIESNLDYPASNYKNPLGDIDLKIEKFSSEGKDGDELNQLTLTNLEFTGSTNQKGKLLNHTHSLGFETLTVGGNSYGPGIYELQMRNIDKLAFEEIQAAIKHQI